MSHGINPTAAGERINVPSSMQAVAMEQYGPPSALQLREISRPVCRDQQVLVRVRAAGVNPIDWRIRNGSLRLILPASFPLVLGFDVAGQVVESRVLPRGDQRNWRPGDEVYAMVDNRHGGGYAEYAVIGAGAVAKKPDSLSFEDAAATPLAALTALQALRDKGQLQSGDAVLVNGASGGVGTFAVQIATALGAEVTAVCSGTNAEFVRGLGAQHVIDYRDADFTANGPEYDIVFDAVGKSSYWKCRRILKRGGAYITTLPSATSPLFAAFSRLFGPRYHIILVRPSGHDLDFLSRLFETDELHPVVDRVFPLAEAAAAHEASEAGHVRGKLVLAVESY